MEVMKQKRKQSNNTSDSAAPMKNDSPVKFGAALGAAFGGGRSGGSGGGLPASFLNSGLARAARQVAGPTQAQQAAAAAAQNPMAGGLVAAAGQAVGGASGSQTLNCTPVAMSYDPPLQANEKGGKKSVFNMNTRGMAEAAFGTPAMRQASVKSPFEVTAKQEAAFGPDSKLAQENPAKAKKIYDGIKAGDNSPAASTYENPTPVIDHSGGYVAAKALDTFGNVFADAITAKYGNKENKE